MCELCVNHTAFVRGGVPGVLRQTMHSRTTGDTARTARGATDVAGEDVKLYIALLEENELLQRQVGEMKMFFKDHGLAWVGTGDYFRTGYRIQQHPGDFTRRKSLCSA